MKVKIVARCGLFKIHGLNIYDHNGLIDQIKENADLDNPKSLSIYALMITERY